MNKKISLEQRAPMIATAVAFFLAVIKFTIWLISGSVSLLSSAIDSLLDMWVSIFNTFAIKYSKKKADADHNYGHWKIEWIAASIEWTIITMSWLYIIYESIRKIITPEQISYLSWSLLVMWISVLVTGGLIYFLNYVYQKTNNLVIKWDALHYSIDFYMNLIVMWVLAIIYFFPYLHWIDGFVGLWIWIYIIKESFSLIKEWINLILDKALEEHEQVKEIIEKYLKKREFESYHCLKTRAGWNKDKFVEFHFVMDPNTTISQAHKVWDKIEEELKKLDTKANWHIIWHSDPYDDSKTNWCD